MESRAYALITGLFVIGLAAAIVVWAQGLGKEPVARAGYRVAATVPVTGLNPQAQVRYRGMSVGRVTNIALDSRDARRILIGIEVDTNIPVTRGTYAQLGLEGITGIAYVHLLDEGKDPQPLAPGTAAEIPLRPSFMDSVADNAEGLVRDARELVAALNALLAPENRRRIGATLASLERITADLETASQKMPGVVARAGEWLSEDNRRLARESLERVNEAARALPELAREAHRLAADTRALVDRVGRLSDESAGAAGELRSETLPRVNALAESVERGAERVGRLADSLERRPESLLWGRGTQRPGPGEPGFQ
jgi:phospholipid/cholesterol/gamma-HCH transport system substrate-binding protein